MSIVKTDIVLPDNCKKLAFILDNVLSEDECEALIQETSDKGYEKAPLIGGDSQILDTTVRNSQRCIIDSKEKANWLWDKIKDFIPETWNGQPIVGLNERLRFLRYNTGEYFKPHEDNDYARPDDSERSFITIQLYLSSGFEGGNTIFLSNKNCLTKKNSRKENCMLCCIKPVSLVWKKNDKQNVGVVPRPGRILVFQHDIMHEGTVLRKGTKYTMRTDIMYNTKLDNPN